MKRKFSVVELGTTYKLPKYRVVDGKGIEEVTIAMGFHDFSKDCPGEDLLNQTITFVRGDKSNNETPRVEGILHESLLAMMIADLKYKNGLVPNKHTACAITHLEDALFRLEERVREREINGTIGTYK